MICPNCGGTARLICSNCCATLDASRIKRLESAVIKIAEILRDEHHITGNNHNSKAYRELDYIVKELKR